MMRSYLRELTFEWGVRCFGLDHMTNHPLRALRLAEETVELAQVLGVEEEKLHQLVRVVYSRPVGEVKNELGGIMITLNCLCAALSIDPEEMFVRELSRCLAKTPAEFKKRNEEKIKLGLFIERGKGT